jgi:uncharacterized protein YoxC
MNEKTIEKTRGIPRLLASIFERMRKESRDSGKKQERIIEEFTVTLNDAFEQVHAEARERERLLEEKLQLLEKEEDFKLRRLKILSVPATFVALAAMGYLFYVVNIMEQSMTSMSSDMGVMRGAMQNMSGDTRSMSGNVSEMNQEMSSMNGNITDLNSNIGVIKQDVGSMSRSVGNMSHSVGGMRQDVGQMSSAVSPVMGGMRSIMPF